MSDVLAYITANSFKFPLKLSLATDTLFHTQISGHTIKEVKVVKSPRKHLPIPIKLPTKNSPERTRPVLPVKSPQATPVQSPKSLSACKVTSPKQKLDFIVPVSQSLKKQEPSSPKPDIICIIKQSLTQEKKEKKAEKARNKQKNEEKLKRKKLLKEFDEATRKENLRFKQKLIIARPKWGLTLKKRQEKFKTKKEVTPKKKREKAEPLSFEVFSTGKNKQIRKKKINDFSIEANDKVEGKKVTFILPTTQFDPFLLGNIQNALKILHRVLELSNKKKCFCKLAKNWLISELNINDSFSSEDIEVQEIMKNKSLDKKAEKKSEVGKSFEKILKNEAKIKVRRKMELVSLKSKDLQEMEKLAEVLGDNPEVKKKFQEMIDRRYSKLETLFEENLENLKQALNLENQTIELKIEEFQSKSKSSDFSSSFINHLNQIENDGQEVDLRKSVENIQEKIEFANKGKPNNQVFYDEDPGQPLISESFIARKQGEESALESMIEEIKSNEESAGDSVGSLDLRHEVVKVNSPILIMEDSFSSSVSGKDQSFSTIKGNQVVETEFPAFEKSSVAEKLENKKKMRVIYEHFPKLDYSSAADRIEASTDTEGFGLIIQRVLFTLEKDIFQVIYNELLENEEFILNLPQKSSFLLQSDFNDFDKKFETDEKVVKSIIQSLQSIKPEKTLKKTLQKIFDPILILSKIQENFDNIEDELYIFEYADLDLIEKKIESSVFSSYETENNAYLDIHNKMIVDVFNEAIIKITKNKIGLPWKIQEQPCLLEYGNLMNECIEKILKWCRIEAGKIPSVEMINSFGAIDENKLLAIRQDNLAQLLILDNEESDSSWIKCDFEETQTGINVSDWLFSELMTEVVQIMLDY